MAESRQVWGGKGRGAIGGEGRDVNGGQRSQRPTGIHAKERRDSDEGKNSGWDVTPQQVADDTLRVYRIWFKSGAQGQKRLREGTLGSVSEGILRKQHAVKQKQVKEKYQGQDKPPFGRGQYARGWGCRDGDRVGGGLGAVIPSGGETLNFERREGTGRKSSVEARGCRWSRAEVGWVLRRVIAWESGCCRHR